MRFKTVIIISVVLAAIGAAAWGGVQVYTRATATPAATVPATTIKRGSVAITITARGDLQGGNPEMLIAPMVAADSLTLTTLRQPGELIEAGSVVAEFDTTQQEYNLREAEADLAEAKQRVIQTEADNLASDEETAYAVNTAQLQVDLAEQELRKNPVSSKIKARDNEIVLQAAKNRLAQAKRDFANRKTTTAAALAIQKAAESRAQVLADMARKNIENMTLKAKTAGYLSLQPNTFGLRVINQGMVLPSIRAGDTVRPGMNVAQLFDLESWEVSSRISELDRGHLAVGQPVSVSIVALPGKTLTGRVKSLGASSGNQWERKFDCRISLDQATPDLRPGMSSKITITAEKFDNVIWAPSQALFERDGRAFVYLKTPSGFTAHDVKLVNRSESQVILAGVNEGDVVALSNPSELNQQSKPGAQQGALKAISK